MNEELVHYILKARRVGYSDSKIKGLLINHGWPSNLVQEGFLDIERQGKKIKTRQIIKGKVKTFVYLDRSVIKSLESRAKKNLFTLNEQIEDILRRSVVGQRRGTSNYDKVDDKLIGIFSRKRTKK